jgi:hypothetical protein
MNGIYYIQKISFEDFNLFLFIYLSKSFYYPYFGKDQFSQIAEIMVFKFEKKINSNTIKITC